MEFVAFVGNDRENWGQITALLKRMRDNKIILVMNKSVTGFPESEAEIVRIDTEQPVLELKKELIERLKSNLSGEFEVTLSLASGTGKEHMALIAALLSIPVGIRLVVYTKEGINIIN